jgi:hypothetical protein
MKSPLLPLLMCLSGLGVGSALHAGSLEISIPQGIDPASVEAEVALYGRGLCISSVKAADRKIEIQADRLASACGGNHDFRPIERIKVLLLIPGYGVASYSGSADDAAVWEPDLEPLPKITLRGSLPSKGLPRDRALLVSIDYPLLEEMAFFEYFDGGSAILPLGSARVDDQGGFEIEIPDLSLDPFIRREGAQVQVRVNAVDHPAPGESLAEYSFSLDQLVRSPLVLGVP